ncbi:MAG: cytochrome ubiquinol oxidase subunit I [Desulfurococcales archaeon]|nr:cytochrome ubiquinol oxidase subunit I [Desulfurococcales archaeon]
MDGSSIAVFWLAYTFGIHIMLVNIGIALSILVPYLKYRAKKNNDEALLNFSYKLMRFYAATYGVAGVYATAFTVFLLSFYPNFLGIAGNIALMPFAIAILLIVVHFTAITTYYYGWNRLSDKAHNIAGIFLALSAVLIPLGFRSVFAFLNTPKGLYFDGTVARLNLLEALSNPTLLPLYLKSLVASLTAGLILVTGYAAVKYYKTSDDQYRNALKSIVDRGVPWALAGLGLMLILGLWYALSLRVVEYKFNNIFGPLGWKVGDGTVAFNLSWLLIIKLILYVAQVYLVYVAYTSIKKSGFLSRKEASNLLFAGMLALVTIVLGEYLNAFSQYPYFIADVTDPKVVQSIPPEVLPYLANVLNLTNVNTLATLTSVQILTIGFMTFLSLATIYFFYIYFKEK